MCTCFFFNKGFAANIYNKDPPGILITDELIIKYVTYLINSYDVHECEQVLLDILLPVKLDHRVIHAQQHLDVIRPLQALSAHSPRPAVVDALLHAPVQGLQVHQAPEVGTCTHNIHKSDERD